MTAERNRGRPEQVGKIGRVYWSKDRTDTKRRTRRMERRWAKRDPEDAPRRRLYRGWWL